ncbi:DUF3344 domain-containing protein [Streptomyces sp. NPDC097619]|uniref:DUF3344 domain-containing protein n=1 Tax=Streptomyces sp. NPDC097619 TaxID=3157228 RepID=UPI0033191F80
MPKAVKSGQAAKSSGRTAFRALAALTVLGLSAALPVASGDGATAVARSGPTAGAFREAARLPFTQRYRAVQHGGLVRASNAGISCGRRAADDSRTCRAVKRGAAGVNEDFDMFYSDLDRDPNTYNSTRAELKVPAGARITYARLYWGGNLRVGEQKPPEDNGRVLVAEPGGEYKEVLADTVVGHRDAADSDAYQASADVTPLIRARGAGVWTVAQLNIAMGQSEAGAWGGWTLVAAYEHPDEPLRELSLWDGFERVEDREAPAAGTEGEEAAGLTLRLDGLSVPAGGAGRAGFVAYDGDRGALGDSLGVTADSGRRVRLSDAENPFNDVMNSTITEFGRPGFQRRPEHVNTLGYDADVFDLAPALSGGARSLSFRFGAESQGYVLGVLFVQADARR